MSEIINYDSSEYDIKKVPLGETVSKTIETINADIKKLEEKKVTKELATEQTDPENPRYKVLSDNNLTDELKEQIDRSRVYYITLPSERGVLSQEDFDKLICNNLSQIIYNNNNYKLAYKDNDIRRYITNVLYQDSTQFIEVRYDEKTWRYNTLANQTLLNHMNDSVAHITQEERNYWNNKVTCVLAGELLEFTKENR